MAEDNIHGDFEFYHYQPSLPAAVIFIVLFATTTIYHVFKLIKARTWYFIPFVIGGICKSSLVNLQHVPH
jgi:hypothetical protein